MDNNKNHCVITEFSTVKSFLLEDSIIAGLKRYDNVWKKCFSNILNFETGGDHMEMSF